MKHENRWKGQPRWFRLTLTSGAVETIAWPTGPRPDRIGVLTDDTTGFLMSWRVDATNPVSPATVDAAPPVTAQEGGVAFVSQAFQWIDLAADDWNELRVFQAAGGNRDLICVFGQAASHGD